MKISGLQNQSLQNLYKQQVDRTGSAGAVGGRLESGQRNEGDSVELSANAQLLHKVFQEIGRGDEASSEKVALLRQQVQNDTYEVSLQKLATSLLSELR